MREACSLIWSALVLLFRSRASLAAEILVLRHQINILRRHSPKRQTFSAIDRLIFAGLYRLAPTVLTALAVLKADTVIKWHRAGFRSYWRWRSRRRGGRPTLPTEIRKFIREMSIANPLWGAPRIHGELLKLGIDIGQTSVAKYMVKRRGPPSQGWKTFLHYHADGIAAMDLFVVPTISFRLLYGLLIMGHGRRQILWFGVTANPTAEWIANQVTEACGWEQAPRYLIRDRDGAYGEVFIRRLRSMGICSRLCPPYADCHGENINGHPPDVVEDRRLEFDERHIEYNRHEEVEQRPDDTEEGDSKPKPLWCGALFAQALPQKYVGRADGAPWPASRRKWMPLWQRSRSSRERPHRGNSVRRSRRQQSWRPLRCSEPDVG